MSEPAAPSPILIVDDDPASRDLLESMLRQMNLEVLTATDGEAAWELIRAGNVQMVLADLRSPKLDAIVLCRRIRAADLPGYVHVVVLTAGRRPSAAVDALDAGADDYLAKPFDPFEVCVRIRVGQRILALERLMADRHEALLGMISG